MPENATNKALIWSSSNPEIVSVSANGAIEAKAAGSAAVTAEAADGSGIKASVTITVQPAVVPVEKITITGAPESMKVGDKAALSAAIQPEDATNQEVVWESSHPEIISIDKDGNIEAKAEGNAEIRATAADDPAVSDLVQIRVQPLVIPVESIVITGVPQAMEIGQKVTLTAEVLPENATNKAVAWTSSNPEAVSVINGEIEAKAPGSATITATATDGTNIAASAQITVNDYTLESIEIGLQEGESASLAIGDILALSASVTPEAIADQAVITWESDAPEIASVDSASGIVTAEKAGTAKITATAVYNGTSVLSNELTITVKAIPVTSITISGEAEREMMLGDIAALSVSVLPTNATDSTVVWTSTDESVVSVNQNNTIMAKAEGTAVITATAKDGFGASASIKVTVKEKTYQVTVTNGTIENGKTQYKYGERAVVTAELTTEAGNFVGWQNANGKFVCYSPTYAFAVLSDVAITAVYAKEEVQKEVVLNCSVNFDAAKDRMVFTGERVVPAAVSEGGKVKAHGIILTATPDIGENEGAFQIGNENEKITNSVAEKTYGLLGTYTVTVKGTTGRTYYARSYVTYIDAETKEEVTMYSNIVKIERP